MRHGKLTQYGSIPTTIDIDNKSGMIVRCTMDLTEFMGKSGQAMDELMPTALGLLGSPERQKQLSRNAEAMALRNAAQVICDEIYKLV